jgi:SAM-dependent methyltransferase
MKYEDWKSWESEDFGKFSKIDARYFRKLLLSFSPKGTRDALELGYGNGGLLGYLRNLGVHTVGVEASSELISRARRESFVVYGSLRELESSPKFDLAIALDVLEHISTEDIPVFLAEIGRLLRPGGRLILRTPNGHSPLGLSNQHGDQTHITVVTTPKLEYWLKDSGLRVIYSGWDIDPILSPNPLKTAANIVRFGLRRFIEKALRLIFRPHPTAVLSANLLTVIEKPRHISDAQRL